MIACASCGRENGDDARFCSGCGAALAESAHPSAREERKVVTVLFVDLVGFTSRAEELDPEDVRAMLSPYYTQLRVELERYGGTVEKFIGDAVMALFGAPTAHEDDPERAVRAALAIRDRVREDERLQVRIGVNTGEALVSLGARPSEGEGMAAGDVVNTAARLQAAAPVNGIFVGERTYRATQQAIEYRESGAIEAKGKDQPVPVWEATEARARFGVDVPQELRSELVGRTRELELLRSALARTREEQSSQLVTLVGVPGIGKSRLLYELSRIVDAEPDLISWRQGRSLPYGEGASFWALAEIVKAQAGVLESDDSTEADRKLAAALADLAPEPNDAEWLHGHLAALVGIVGGDSVRTDDRRSEAFAAWRRFFESLAEQRPLVLVFEDLHWADDDLLDFVDHLVDWASGVPILVVASARPELLERRPGWGGGKPNATTLSLSPLSDDDAARLVASLRGSSVIEATAQAELLERVGGNPLYAEQYIQMLDDVGSGDELPLLDSIQGIVGARLDALAAHEKEVLQDAAVVGKVFWPGAVVALGGAADRFQLEDDLHSLERKQFVRRDRRTSVANETEYAFLHILIRDVAYARIPRATRLEKHIRAAEWIEALGRTEDHAEMLAHHYSSGLEVAGAAGLETAHIAPRARAALVAAGDRAYSLSAYAAAARFYREALALWPETARRERADVLFRLARAAFDCDEPGRDELLDEARQALIDVGDRERAAEAESLLAQFAWMNAEREQCFARLERARELIQGEAPSPGKARVLSQIARFQALAGELDPDVAREALALAEELDLDEIRAGMLITVGMTDFRAGGPSGRADTESGLQIALARNRLPIVIRAYSALAASAELEGDLREAARCGREAERAAERLGGAASLRWTRGNMITMQLELGEWDQCARDSDEFLAESARSGPHYHDAHVLLNRALLRLGRGDVEAAVADQAEGLERARRIKDPQCVYPALALSASILAQAGCTEEANRLFDELIAVGPELFSYVLKEVVWAADRLGRRDAVAALLPESPETTSLRAARALAAGNYVDAAALWDSMGAVDSAAHARLRAAEELVADGRRAEANEQLERALTFFRSVGARLYVRRAEALLAASA